MTSLTPPPQEFISDRSNAVVLLWFFVAFFGVRLLMTFHLMFIHNFLSGKSLVGRIPVNHSTFPGREGDVST